jgi:hypothetical protein
VIRFLDRLSRPTAPAWLAGAEGLAQRRCRDGVLWAIGDPITLGDDGPWIDIGDGISVAGPVESHAEYERNAAWLRTVTVSDLRGRAWEVPVILDERGERAFCVSYGADFLPAPTPEQYRMLDIAKAARDALIAASSGTQDIPMQMACRWAAELLCASYHLTPETVAALAILDDELVLQIIGNAVGLPVEVAP